MSQIDKVFLGSGSIASFISSTIVPVATAAASSVEQSFTIKWQPAPLLATDIVQVSPPGAPGAGIGIAGARISGTGQLVLNFVNPTAGALTFPTCALAVVVIRP